METNWNQLIERYLQNELSEEGKTAFEQELNANPSLREELEMHQLIRSAAKRASQRTIIQQAGKSYYKSLRIKQFTIGVVVTAVTTAGIVYWVQSKKQAERNEPKPETTVVAFKENTKESADTKNRIEDQPSPTGDKSSLIQSSGGKTQEIRSGKRSELKSIKPEAKTLVSLSAVKRQKLASQALELKNLPGALAVDSLVSSPVSSEKLSGYTDEGLNGVVAEQPAKMEWIAKYDSVGKFNDIYCGFALVMHREKFGFADFKGDLVIPLYYDKIVVTSNLKYSKHKHRRKKKQNILYVPKRSGKDVRDCEEEFRKPATLYEIKETK